MRSWEKFASLAAGPFLRSRHDGAQTLWHGNVKWQRGARWLVLSMANFFVLNKDSRSRSSRSPQLTAWRCIFDINYCDSLSVFAVPAVMHGMVVALEEGEIGGWRWITCIIPLIGLRHEWLHCIGSCRACLCLLVIDWMFNHLFIWIYSQKFRS